MLTYGGHLIASSVASSQSYASATVARTDPAAKSIFSDDLIAWLTVDGTPIDYPVCKPSENRGPDFYLTHDAWGKPSQEGCPFLDARSSPYGPHALIYGHHLGLSQRMFSPLATAWQQEEFNTLGPATLETPHDKRVYTPLCALKVTEDFQPIQTFDFGGNEELRAWLVRFCESASARTKNWRQRVRSASNVITLVTCTSILPGQSVRTLVLFTSP